ncbi:hypothetical protein OUZ56_029361 [Daphnia magna]|uniref:Uncharacterized protein n=1 Tax=Daphnia magna TaxID=35525 RepID=A0ABR0B6L8_9CRUS|nr:hypothetical protein OUZ56_029361 [Daphnia magna]
MAHVGWVNPLGTVSWISFLMGKPTLRLSTHRFNCPATMAIETLEATLKIQKPKSVSIAPTSPTVYKNNVDKEIITRNNNFGACVDVVSNFYSSFRA